MAPPRAIVDVWTADVTDPYWRSHHNGRPQSDHSGGGDFGADDLSAVGRALRDAALARPDDAPHNLSHSDRRVVFAVARGPGVTHLGVDVETLRPIPRPDAFARRILADGEVVAARDLIVAWTLKEAALKATGVGLTGDARAWSFEGHAAEPRLLAAPQPWGPVEHWAFLRTTLGEDSPLALAIRLETVRSIDVFIHRISAPPDRIRKNAAVRRLTWSPQSFPATS